MYLEKVHCLANKNTIGVQTPQKKKVVHFFAWIRASSFLSSKKDWNKKSTQTGLIESRMTSTHSKHDTSMYWSSFFSPIVARSVQSGHPCYHRCTTWQDNQQLPNTYSLSLSSRRFECGKGVRRLSMSYCPYRLWQSNFETSYKFYITPKICGGVCQILSTLASMFLASVVSHNDVLSKAINGSVLVRKWTCFDRVGEETDPI